MKWDKMGQVLGLPEQKVFLHSGLWLPGVARCCKQIKLRSIIMEEYENI